MSAEQAIQSFQNLLAEAEAEFVKANRDLEKAKKRQAAASSKLSTLREAFEKITSGVAGESKTQGGFQDSVRSIIFDAGESGITAADIQKELERQGHADGKNPSAAVQVAARRLVEKGLIEVVDGDGVKAFRKKPVVKPAGSPPASTEEDEF